jgi:hypothetical protein
MEQIHEEAIPSQPQLVAIASDQLATCGAERSGAARYRTATKAPHLRQSDEAKEIQLGCQKKCRTFRIFEAVLFKEVTGLQRSEIVRHTHM